MHNSMNDKDFLYSSIAETPRIIGDLKQACFTVFHAETGIALVMDRLGDRAGRMITTNYALRAHPLGGWQRWVIRCLVMFISTCALVRLHAN